MTLPARSEPLLTVRDLAVWFETGRAGTVKAVDAASFTVYAGQTLAIVGESGCGKSVTAMSLLRLIPSPPARYVRGSAFLKEPGAQGIDLMKASERQLRSLRGGSVAMIFQEPMTSLNPVFTVGEQVAEAVRLHRRLPRREAMEAAVRALERVGINNAAERANAYPHEFSGGMRQRVMIAMALACRPRLLLADEPTTALDVTVQAQILDLLSQLRQEFGLGVVLITHDLGIVASRADVVCVMYAGHVVEYTDVFSLFRQPLHPYTRGLLASIPRDGVTRLRSVRDLIADRRELDLTTAQGSFTAWWPSVDEPQQRADPDPGLLIEAAPGHWVRVQPGAEAARFLTDPDISYSRVAALAKAPNTEFVGGTGRSS